MCQVISTNSSVRQRELFSLEIEALVTAGLGVATAAGGGLAWVLKHNSTQRKERDQGFASEFKVLAERMDGFNERLETRARSLQEQLLACETRCVKCEADHGEARIEMARLAARVAELEADS